jgi:hypothetical protein
MPGRRPENPAAICLPRIIAHKRRGHRQEPTLKFLGRITMRLLLTDCFSRRQID